MTKDTGEFSQFTDSVACREYTLPRDESLTEPKGWIRVNGKIGPVLEVTTSWLQGKYGAAGKKLSSTVAIGGSTQMCSTLIQYLQGMNPNLKVRCQQCIA